MHVRSRLSRWKFCSSTQRRETKRECPELITWDRGRLARTDFRSMAPHQRRGAFQAPNRFDRTSEKLHTLLFGGCETVAPQNTSANNLGDTERTELRHGVHGVNHPGLLCGLHVPLSVPSVTKAWLTQPVHSPAFAVAASLPTRVPNPLTAPCSR